MPLWQIILCVYAVVGFIYTTWRFRDLKTASEVMDEHQMPTTPNAHWPKIKAIAFMLGFIWAWAVWPYEAIQETRRFY